MCKFFKQPPDPIGAEEPHLANWTTHNWIVTTSLSANFGIGPRACKRFPFVTVGNISSITQKHGRIKSSRFMASLLIRLANQLKIVDFMSLFLCKNYLHIGLIRNLRAFLNLGNPERKTCLTLRQRLARFVRKTLSFSRIPFHAWGLSEALSPSVQPWASYQSHVNHYL